jgi:hypothetical protein
MPEEHLLYGRGGDLKLPELPDVGGDHHQPPPRQQARQRHESGVIAAQFADAGRKHDGGGGRPPGRTIAEGLVVAVPVAPAHPVLGHDRVR